jgi:hypothetical protein
MQWCQDIFPLLKLHGAQHAARKQGDKIEQLMQMLLAPTVVFMELQP